MLLEVRSLKSGEYYEQWLFNLNLRVGFLLFLVELFDFLHSLSSVFYRHLEVNQHYTDWPHTFRLLEIKGIDFVRDYFLHNIDSLLSIHAKMSFVLNS